MDAHSVYLIALRWSHFVAGVAWIGLLYFFNLVNVNFMKTLDAATKSKVVPELMPRALWWFRWGAVATVVPGLLLVMDFVKGGGSLTASSWGRSIMAGGGLGLIMFFNVWVIIWPNQKKVIAAVKAGQAADPVWARRAYLASRTNFVLSFPMLFFMGAASHFPVFGSL